jgi:hypothetical protein
MTFSDWIDNETPCGRCGHDMGWHRWPGRTFTPECLEAAGTPDSCECPNYQEPIE